MSGPAHPKGIIIIIIIVVIIIITIIAIIIRPEAAVRRDYFI